MAAEKYIESVIIRQDNRPEVDAPTLVDDDCDAVYDFRARVQLKQILKAVQNVAHNRHDYVFQILEITKLQKES